MGIQRLNHAVLWVGDIERSLRFYTEVLRFTVVHQEQGAAFLRAENSDNDHDLGLFATPGETPHPRAVGLYHLAWSVRTLRDLGDIGERLAEADALVGASDHTVSKSYYGKDPDGIEFEIAWFVPRDVAGELADSPGTLPLNLERELARWGEDLVGAP